MKSWIERLPLLISGVRIVLLPLLWYCAFQNWQKALALGLLVAIVSDWLDGQVGRWLGHDSEQESRFDSLADKLLTVSVLAWLFWLHPNILFEQSLLIVLVLGLGLTSWLVGLLRHRSILGLHLTLAKYAGLCQGLFVLHTFWNGSYSVWFFYLAASLWCIAACEEIAVQLRNPQINRHTRSLFKRPPS